MSDIIQDAKKLLEGATPGPWVASDSGYIGSTSGVMIHDGQVLGDTTEDTNLIAAAPEFAQALAEEEYQYGVTYIGVNHGGHHIEWVESTGDAEWDKESLQLLVKRWKRKGQSPKVIRRRVSPPEVINE